MTDVGLHGTDRAGVATCSRADDVAERGDLDRIADGRGRAVGLDVGDRIGVDARVRKCRPDDARLSGDRRGGVPHLRGPVVVDRAAPDHRDDVVAVLDGILEAAEDNDTAATAEDGARGLGVESAAVTVGREDQPVLAVVPDALRYRDRHPADQRDIALADSRADFARCTAASEVEQAVCTATLGPVRSSL